MTVRKCVWFVLLFSAMSYWLTAQEKAVTVTFDVDDLDNQVASLVTANKLNFNIEINSILENVNVTNTVSAQNEAAMAVNPADGQHIVIAMNDYAVGTNGLSGQSVAYSRDGGATWTMRAVPVVSSDLQALDPAVVFSNDGKVYMAYAVVRTVNKFTVGSGIYLVRSDDGGSTWSAPVAVVDGLNDALAVHTRPCLAVNPANNELAVAWVKNEGSQSRATAYVKRTADGAAFSEAIAVNDQTARARNISLAYNLSGELFAAWYNFNAATANVTKISGTSVQLLSHFAVNPIGTADGTSRIIKNTLKVNNYPVLAIDQSVSKTSGAIYMVWASQENGSPDIFITVSKDNGTTWSAPAAIHPNRRNDQFFPSVSVDRTTGAVNVIYYDSRNDANNQLIDVYLSQSIDGGRSFVDARLSNTSFDPAVGPFSGKVIGDYNAVSSGNGSVYAAWADTRKGNDQDIFFCKYQGSANGVNTAKGFVLNQNYPNPFNPVTEISYELNQDVHVILSVYNSLGQLVKTLVNERQATGVHTLNFNAKELASGVYFYRLQAGDAVSVKKMMLIK